MIFSTLNRHKNKNIQPRPEKQINIRKKKTVYTRQRKIRETWKELTILTQSIAAIRGTVSPDDSF